MGSVSLLTSHETDIVVYDKTKIPMFPKPADGALRNSQKKLKHTSSSKENSYVTWLYHRMHKGDIPDDELFTERKSQSLNVKDKFCLLKDVEESKFCDMVVDIVKNWHEGGDKVTLWVSDYTKNSKFFPHKADTGLNHQDPYGYTSSATQLGTRKWRIPYGKRSMQLTCYEPHAQYIREQYDDGDWAIIRNVQIKFGHNMGNLEGFLREDPSSMTNSKVLISLINPTEVDPDAVHPRLKEALCRKRHYLSEMKNLHKSLDTESGTQTPHSTGSSPLPTKSSNPMHSMSLKPKSNEATKGAATKGAANNEKKRPAEEVVPNHGEPPAKVKVDARRKGKRSGKRGPRKNQNHREQNVEGKMYLNPSIRCEHMSEPITPIQEMVKPSLYNTVVEGIEREIALPFTNVRYRTVGRVVNYHPANIAEFAQRVTHAKVESGCVRNNEVGGDSDEEDEDKDEDQRGASQDTILSQPRPAGRNRCKHKSWEWRFALELEDTYPSTKKVGGGRRAKHGKHRQKLWVLVGNHAAQCLLDMDAVEIVGDEGGVEKLRSKLFHLWGDLEEQKMERHKSGSSGGGDNCKGHDHSRVEKGSPDSSDCERDGARAGAGASDGGGGGSKEKEAGDLGERVSNRPFAFCVSQHGIEVPETDPKKANAGREKRWEPVFEIFGTKICDGSCF